LTTLEYYVLRPSSKLISAVIWSSALRLYMHIGDVYSKYEVIYCISHL
jgi:hypothetical protein